RDACHCKGEPGRCSRSLLFSQTVSSSSPLVINRNCSVTVQGLLYAIGSSMVTCISSVPMFLLRNRSVTCSASVVGLPALSSHVFPLKPLLSTTNVSPSHLPMENPSHDGFRSAANSRPSVKIWRHKVIASWRITIWLGVWMIFHGGGAAAVFGTPGGRQLASDSSRACAPPARDSTSAFAHG